MGKQAKTKSPESKRKLFAFLKENPFDSVSLIVSILSLIISVYIGFQANEIAMRSQPLDYSVTANEYIDMIAMNDTIYTCEGVVFKQVKGVWSGELSSVFIATVQDGKADVHYIPEQIPDIGAGFTAENGTLFCILPDNPNELLFSPLHTDLKNINDSLQTFHLIFKGYNKEYTIYTVVYSYDTEYHPGDIEHDGEKIASCGRLRIYILDEDTMYDSAMLNQIADDLNKGSGSKKFTAKGILETITAERALAYDSMKDAH